MSYLWKEPWLSSTVETMVTLHERLKSRILRSQNIGEVELQVHCKTNSEITEKHKINTLYCTMSLTFLIVSYCFLYNNITSHFDAWPEKNNVAQQDLHLCQYSSPKKCPDINQSVTVAMTITTWFKKCLSSKLSITDDEKSDSIFHFYYVAFFAFNYQSLLLRACTHTPMWSRVFIWFPCSFRNPPS